ncbi:MAG: DegT/DnrJ/EryC1/StrS family aminotransferase [Fibrobacter sp.]|nr:DegT/DnrJ/EryC1/StrS family aminotransferase [Fibrobacter sp.]
MIPFVNLVGQRNKYREELEKMEKTILDSGSFIGGEQVANLEKELSQYIHSHSRNAKMVQTVTCASGTDALTIALMSLGIEKGDEVIVPDFTFIAPAECVCFLGGTPKFADIDMETLQISAESVAQQITGKTKGIIAVNLFGQCAPFEKLRKIAEKHNLWIIEDSAQAFGATQGGQAACTFGDISITSFYPTKPLGCYGDGGALFTANDSLADRIRMIANHGSRGHYQHEIIGVNSRLDALQAGVLRVKLSHLDEELKIRQENAHKYNVFFRKTAGVKPQKVASGNASTIAQYTLLADDRPAFIEKMKKAEIPYCIHYPATLQNQKCFSGLRGQNIGKTNTNAALAASKAISLPVCPFTPVDDIIEKISEVL